MAGGLVYGTAPALVTLGAAAPLRGRRLGFLNAAIGCGFASGPLLAGVLIDAFGWRAIFHARVPAALVALAWALAVRRSERVTASRRLVAARDILRASVLFASGLSFVANAAIFALWLLAAVFAGRREIVGFQPAFAEAFTLAALAVAVAAVAGLAVGRAAPYTLGR